MTPPARLATATVMTACIMLAACMPPKPAAGPTARTLTEVEILRVQNAGLRERLLQRDEQVLTLQALGEKRLEQLYTVKRIRLGASTCGADTDAKPGDDALKVVIEPIDQHGSVIKAAGSVKVRVFDLAAPKAKTLLAESSHDPNTVTDHWVSGFMGGYFAFTCPLPAPPGHGELTVRVEFVEYLTGKTFTAQKVVKVALPAEAETRPATQPVTAPAKKP